MKIKIITGLSFLSAAQLLATTLATESFDTESPGGYTSGEDFPWYVSPVVNNDRVVVGNIGFSNADVISDMRFGNTADAVTTAAIAHRSRVFHSSVSQ